MCRSISIALEGIAGYCTIGPGAPWSLVQITQKRPHPSQRCSMRPKCWLAARPSCASISTRSTGGPILASSAYILGRALIPSRRTGSILIWAPFGWRLYLKPVLRWNACFWMTDPFQICRAVETFFGQRLSSRPIGVQRVDYEGVIRLAVGMALKKMRMIGRQIVMTMHEDVGVFP